MLYELVKNALSKYLVILSYHAIIQSPYKDEIWGEIERGGGGMTMCNPKK